MSTQEFSTCADAGVTIQGSFTLTYNDDSGYGKCRSDQVSSREGANVDGSRTVEKRSGDLEMLTVDTTSCNKSSWGLNLSR